MQSSSPSTSRRLSSSTPLMSTRCAGRASLNAMVGTRLCPPASTRPSCGATSARMATASSTVFGAGYLETGGFMMGPPRDRPADFTGWPRARTIHGDEPGRERTDAIEPATPGTAMSAKLDITLNVNGQDYAIRVEPRKTLVDAIREECGQTGTHIGCEHGICGACTVIVNDEAVRACLMFAVQAAGKRIRTVEGLAKGDTLHPLQRAFMEHHGLQCGFCTPGFLMLATNVLEQRPDIDDEDLLDVLASNLCRCTGYQNIIKAVRAAAAEMRGAAGAGSGQRPE